LYLLAHFHLKINPLVPFGQGFTYPILNGKKVSWPAFHGQ